ncbi:MAG: FixH family protein, partial [Rhodospirillaceae bacterium]
GAAVWVYRRPGRAPGRSRAALLALRLSALAVFLFALLRPVLVVRTVEPERNVLAVLVDGSRSMDIADLDARPRSAFVRDTLGPSGALRAALARRFAIRDFAFASTARRVPGPAAMEFTGTRSYIGRSLQRTAEELAGLPVSGIVLVTDGADTSREPMADSIRALKAAGVPVFAVGLGREALDRDVQIGRVDPPATVLKGATLVAEVVISQTGYAGRTVPLVVEDEGRVVASQDVTLPPDGEPSTVRVRFTLAEPGPRVVSFRVGAQDGEQVTQNNARQALITVQDRRERVLYVEGQPRFEMKFLRQAVAGDANLQLVTLQRTADRKFLRLDIDAPEDLAGGFPKTRDELFAYRGLILGSIEATAFTADQQRMIADFVNQRGGGLLALGGRRAFAEGGYAGTAVADVLPVQLDDAKAAADFVEEIKVSPTRLGQTHVATQIASTEQLSADRWASLPALTTVNPVHRVKPGGAVLLEGRGASSPEPQVVLAYQRYGAGKVLAMPVQDLWMWRMHASVPLEDVTHETLCRRLLRWLVDGVPDRVAAAVNRDRVEAGDTVTVTANVRDGGFLGLNDATVTASVTGPTGDRRDVPMSFVVDRDGEYRATFAADRDGLYQVDVTATRAGEAVGTDTAFVRAAPDDGEYFDAAMRATLLKRLAEDTGGRFYTASTADSLADDITYLGRGVTVVQERDLWDMPIVLALLVGLVGGEWFLRRRVGLP